MIFKFVKKSETDLFVLLHGTGGDETSLIDLGRLLHPDASLLGVRGNVNENGMNRFFKRLRPGVFDLDSLVKETNNLKFFLDDFLKEHHFKYANTVVIGYSNGANIIGSVIFHYGGLFKGVALLHPMVPIQNFDVKNQDSQNIFITASKSDPIVQASESSTLAEMLKTADAKVRLNWYSYGHNISEEELTDLSDWLSTI